MIASERGKKPKPFSKLPRREVFGVPGSTSLHPGPLKRTEDADVAFLIDSSTPFLATRKQTLSLTSGGSLYSLSLTAIGPPYFPGAPTDHGFLSGKPRWNGLFQRSRQFRAGVYQPFQWPVQPRLTLKCMSWNKCIRRRLKVSNWGESSAGD